MLSSAYKLSPIFLLLTTLFAVFVAYHYKEKSALINRDNLELTSKLEQLQQQAIKINQIIAENTTVKRDIENESIKQQQEISEELADNSCANTPVPVGISERLHKHANQIRQSTNTVKSTK